MVDFEFPEDGDEDEKNRWAADTIAQWEGAHFCEFCHNRMNYDSATGRYWCYYCDDGLSLPELFGDEE